MNAKALIESLKLQPHPEGGYYRETYRCDQNMEVAGDEDRSISTAIYYLLQDKDRSRFHRLRFDELWFFHQGAPVEILTLGEKGFQRTILGNDLQNGETPQALIRARTWFAAKLRDEKGYSLVSCTVAPGFDFSDFELASREKLLKLYPGQKEIIEAYTY